MEFNPYIHFDDTCVSVACGINVLANSNYSKFASTYIEPKELELMNLALEIYFKEYEKTDFNPTPKISEINSSTDISDAVAYSRYIFRGQASKEAKIDLIEKGTNQIIDFGSGLNFSNLLDSLKPENKDITYIDLDIHANAEFKRKVVTEAITRGIIETPKNNYLIKEFVIDNQNLVQNLEGAEIDRSKKSLVTCMGVLGYVDLESTKNFLGTLRSFFENEALVLATAFADIKPQNNNGYKWQMNIEQFKNLLDEIGLKEPKLKYTKNILKQFLPNHDEFKKINDDNDFKKVEDTFYFQFKIGKDLHKAIEEKNSNNQPKSGLETFLNKRNINRSPDVGIA